MSTVQAPISDMLVTVKSREVQRGLQAAMAGQTVEAEQHFLAAAHLELVLARDYQHAGEPDLSLRSRISAASCFWRAGDQDRARTMLAEIARDEPSRKGEIEDVIEQLER